MDKQSPKRIASMVLLLVAVALLTLLFTRAQAAQPELPEGVGLDPRTWVASAGVLAATVLFAVDWLKGFLPFLKDATTRWVSMGISVVIPVGVELWDSAAIEGGIISALVMGISAAVIAGGLADRIGKISTASTSTKTIPR